MLFGFYIALEVDLLAWTGLAYYLELGSYFPNRAGADVVYLEQAYKRPKYFFPAAFAVCPKPVENVHLTNNPIRPRP